MGFVADGDSTVFRTPNGIAVPSVTTTQMRAVDRIATEDIGVSLIQMMEHAGRTLAGEVLETETDSAVVVAGNGGNGGGGLACARHLANRDVAVDIVLDREPESLDGAAARQYNVLDEMGVPVRTELDTPKNETTVAVDALIGYGLTDDVRERATQLVRGMNEYGTIISLDVPSGIDATTGETRGVSVNPDRTVTLALPKTGLEDRPEPITLADIGLPAVVYERLDIAYQNPFGRAFTVKIHQ